MQNIYYFRIRESYEYCIHLYTPGVNSVVLVAEDGQRVKLPTVNLRPFVEQRGLLGRFRLVTDCNNKVKSFERVVT
ncbi:DUF2835 family protein [Alteromonadaceae bacterium BrNp21-10]|nr:DUF2835 family protein [Alteromonadaceae bacterium BrNp21-10]